MTTEYITALRVLPMPWTTTGARALIASGAIVPPPGPVSRPLGTFAVQLVAAAALVGACLLGFLWGLGTR